jgi:UDPglucose 6-dehydrogenase
LFACLQYLLRAQVDDVSMFMEMDYTLGVNETTQPDLKKLMQLQPDPYTAAEGSHAVVVLTEWDEFRTLDYQRIYDSMLKPAFFFDGRNIMDHDALRKIGFEVHAIGKGRLIRETRESLRA